MRYALLWLFLLPVVLIAQNTDPRIAPPAQPGVKSSQVTVTKIYEITIKVYDTVGPPGIPIPVGHREKKTVYDTALKETRLYNKDGRLTSLRSASWDSTSTEYQYTSDTVWIATASQHDRMYDSTLRRAVWAGAYRLDTVAVAGNSAVGKYRWANGTDVLLYNRDSCLTRSISFEGKASAWKLNYSSRNDSFWDYQNAGVFAGKTISHSAERDTVKYLDKNGRCIIKVINHFDSLGRPARSDYYNYSVKWFAIQRMWIQPLYMKTYFLPINRSGQPSCKVYREYNERGLLVEERIVNNQQNLPFTIVKRYSYEYYQQ